MPSSSTEPFILLLIILVLSVLLYCFVLWRRQKALNHRLNKSIQLINDLYAQYKRIEQTKGDNKHEHDLAKITTNVESLTAQLQHLQKRLDVAENKIDLVEQEQPQTSLYKKANQLASKGASIEDIMEACELPRAEVEVLMSLQRK